MTDLSTTQAAAQISVRRDTVAHYAAQGLLPGAYRLHGTGPWRIPADALEALKPDSTQILAPRNRRSRGQQKRGAA